MKKIELLIYINIDLHLYRSASTPISICANQQVCQLQQIGIEQANMPYSMDGLWNKGLTHCMAMLQEDTLLFRSREHYPPTMVIQERLKDVDWGHVQLCGLEHVHEWPDLRAHSAQLSALIEQWHTPTGRFHLLTGEATITLLDVWKIL